jgi:3-dehydroquinate synthase
MKKQEVIICQNLSKNLSEAIQSCPHDKVFILVDIHTRELCLPILAGIKELEESYIITIGADTASCIRPSRESLFTEYCTR